MSQSAPFFTEQALDSALHLLCGLVEMQTNDIDDLDES
jgi:hypothetical protein